MESIKVAKPLARTRRKVAICETCGDQIVWHQPSRRWYHDMSGSYKCSSAYQSGHPDYLPVEKP